MKPRILAFPVAVAAIVALDGCNILDAMGPHPTVRLCREDTIPYTMKFSNGAVAYDTIIWHERNPGHCIEPKAA